MGQQRNKELKIETRAVGTKTRSNKVVRNQGNAKNEGREGKGEYKTSKNSPDRRIAKAKGLWEIST